MKRLLILSAALVTGSMSLAQEVGRVISSTPIIAQVGQPRNVCTTEQIAVQAPKSGAGALMGAIAGGAVGNAIGGGSGQVAATMLGIFGGAIVGDNIEGQPMAQVQNVQRCTTQTFYENRAMGYNVVYEYAGKQYSVQMPGDPGPTVQLQITPVGANLQEVAPAAATSFQQPIYAQPIYAQPTTIVMTQQPYPVYQRRSYYPPISLNLGYIYWRGANGGHYGRRH